MSSQSVQQTYTNTLTKMGISNIRVGDEFREKKPDPTSGDHWIWKATIDTSEAGKGRICLQSNGPMNGPTMQINAEGFTKALEGMDPVDKGRIIVPNFKAQA